MSRFLKLMFIVFSVAALTAGAVGTFAQGGSHTSSQFQGPKANKGTVTHSHKDGKNVLTFSDDFVVPPWRRAGRMKPARSCWPSPFMWMPG